MMKRNYIGFAKRGNMFGPAEGNGEYTPILEAGHYRISYNDYDDMLELTKFTPRMDEILNLGCKEFNYVIDMAQRFLSRDKSLKFKSDGFLHKRSWLFYGPPGTGKSVLTSKLSDIAAKERNAICLYPDSYDALERVMEVLDATDKDRFKTIVLEEFDDLVSGRDEASWTTLLDGQFQSDNRLVLATTNNVGEIPQRLIRPGRFSQVVEIPALSALARDNFLKMKGVNDKQRKHIVEQTNGFTVDDLKEIYQSVFILDDDVDMIISFIKNSKTLGKNED